VTGVGREPVVESAGKPQLVPAQEDGDVAGRTSHTTVLYVIAARSGDDRAYRVGACEGRVQE
jgi:hypothetical protein